MLSLVLRDENLRLAGGRGVRIMEPDINPNNTVQAHLTVPGVSAGGPGRGRREGNVWVNYHGSKIGGTW